MAKKKPSLPAGSPGDSAASPGEGPGFDAPYVVLARKYRPETFAELIGQDAMVTTLRNAFAADRIAQGYMLTGVRGVGKTTTARILARALNYAKPGLPDRPTVEMDGYGEHCLSIIQTRHPDVIEMDAASNTGVDDVREIIENARYKPLLARYKVFIVDEVHMLSKNAFNALLKTLEEPPAHVKFIFATTEVRKVPVTVLSRCQRFDLRRVEPPLLVGHFKSVLAKEGASADDEALALIARAAGGSVRDGLSILDQAIAMGRGTIGVSAVRAMLGLADRGRIFDLLELLLGGAAAQALSEFDRLHGDGGDPVQILCDLAEAVHTTSRVKIAGSEGAGEALSSDERRRAVTLAERLSVPALSRVWQMLQKGIDEVARSGTPVLAAEMVLIRIAHAADLPAPEDLVRLLGQGGGRPAPVIPAAPAPTQSQPQSRVRADAGTGFVSPSPWTTAAPESFAHVIELAGEHRDARLKVHLEEHVSLVRFEVGRLDIHLLPGAPAGLANEVSEKLARWTGQRWVVVVSRERGEPPYGEVRRNREAAEIAGIRQHPALQAVLEIFPDAEVKVRPLPAGEQDESATG